MSENHRRIAHLDMDAFYASVELLRYPQLRGFPTVIGGGRRAVDQVTDPAQGERPLHRIPVDEFPRLKDYVGRGVITTATYTARQFGVGSALGLMKAAKLCPQAILLPADFAEYRKYSRTFKSIIAEIAPLIEDRGIDEVYIDFTDVPGGRREGGRVLARLIQKSIFDATGLTCSIGVAPNKLLAKMASEFRKPNGISVILESDLHEKIWPLAARKIQGIGPKTDAALQRLGVQTIGDLAQKDLQWLIDHFGQKGGAWMYDAARGHDERSVLTESEPVSVSRETTFAHDLHAGRDKVELGAIFTRLCQQVANDLNTKGYLGKTIGIKLRYADFKCVTRDQTLTRYTADSSVIRHTAGLCLKRVSLAQPLRLLGVRVGTLRRVSECVPESDDPAAAALTSASVASSVAANGQLF